MGGVSDCWYDPESLTEVESSFLVSGALSPNFSRRSSNRHIEDYFGMTTRVGKPMMAGEMLDRENDFAPQFVENPLEVTSRRSLNATPAASIVGASSIQATPSITERRGPLDDTHGNDVLDEAPPPYSEYEETQRDAPQIAAIEYSSENSPQIVIAPHADFPEVSEHFAAERTERFTNLRTFSTALGSHGPPTPSTMLGSPVDGSLWPDPLQVRQPSTSTIPRRPVPSPNQLTPATSFSSAKAREAGFEIEQPPTLDRGTSSSSSPNITILPSTTPIKHTREPGRTTAYLAPFPKPQLKGVKPEDIPSRFLIYTPPLPPLSKPAPGEKESQWHKTQRLWQEDVRRATMTNASRVTWKGMKAKGTSLINKGVSKTRSSTVEFLDRVSGGAITSTTQDIVEDVGPTAVVSSTLERNSDSIQELPAASPPAELSGETSSISSTLSTPTISGMPPMNRASSVSSTGSTPRPRALDHLTLIHPPSLTLSPEEIRTEFVSTLLRTREQSRNQALVASALLPIAATIDVALVVTFGGLTQTTGVWAYQNTRGAIASKKMTRGLARSESYHVSENGAVELDTEIRGCTCGHHEDEFGCAESVAKGDKKGKLKKEQEEDKGIAMNMQSSLALEPFARYLERACLQKSFSMFPHIEAEQSSHAGIPTEDEILEAMGWAPTRRYGRDLEIAEHDGRTQKLTAEQDEDWQRKEAREDVERVVRKAAAEWVAACKGFGK
ncbi:hypothetical protein DPSP01_005374 [Paraphaeosphaeria sporulosa]